VIVAAAKPDLIIHVGDYHYRETPCPSEQAGCAGSPSGDTWAVWRADFFAPAGQMLTVAPWVFVRGNHEDCERGGRGWSRTLEPFPFDSVSGCNGPAPPYTISFSKLALAVIDTVLARESKVDPQQVTDFRAQYARLSGAGNPIWLLQHRPIWSAGGTAAGIPYGDNKTLAAAARETLPAPVELMVSGHHHLFQALNFKEALPPQIVAGHGGDYLNIGQSQNPAGWKFGDVTVVSGVHDVGSFGYLLAEQQGESWVLTNYDVEGTPRHVCTLDGRLIECRKH
jgi:hypothetical protein